MSFEIKTVTTTTKSEHTRRDSAYVKKPKINIGEEINGIKIDGKIGDFKQGSKGDCVLLSVLLGIRDKDWGKEAFSKAVRPDGEGGAIVEIFPNPLFNLKRTYHITNKDLLRAKNFKNDEISAEDKEFIRQLRGKSPEKYDSVTSKYDKGYTRGDDDVLALELSLEQYLKERFDSTQLTHRDNDKIVDPLNSNTIFQLRLDPSLLTGNNIDIGTNQLNHYNHNPYWDKRTPSEKNNILNYLETVDKNKQITAICSFKDDKRLTCDYSFKEGSLTENLDLEDGKIYNTLVFAHHAYSLKRFETVEDVKYVVFENPHDSSKEIKLPYNTFLKYCRDISVYSDQNARDEIFEKCNNNINEDLNENLDKYVVQENLKIYSNLSQQVYENLLAKLKEVPKEERNNIINDFFNAFYFDSSELRTREALMMTNILLDNLEGLIRTLDDMEYGWGHGQAKKDLIKPFVDKILAKIQKNHERSGYEKGSESGYEQYAENCIKELDAIFYTDSDVIIENLRVLLEKCKRDFEYKISKVEYNTL